MIKSKFAFAYLYVVFPAATPRLHYVEKNGCCPHLSGRENIGFLGSNRPTNAIVIQYRELNTRDFSSRSFSAGSLRKDIWKALGERLEKAGIPVRSEI
ncbi:MAG: hypothetical protein BGO55_19650 [Sphingobacteriales bacterium 50-39]|nr:hypothetical protein [Sphingobacteriales bacterium]OJW58926.1 MAG: hypothetical protein BGO55_19650 [Sphingobacteriales bacterium 50-39]